MDRRDPGTRAGRSDDAGDLYADGLRRLDHPHPLDADHRTGDRPGDRAPCDRDRGVCPVAGHGLAFVQHVPLVHAADVDVGLASRQCRSRRTARAGPHRNRPGRTADDLCPGERNPRRSGARYLRIRTAWRLCGA